MTEYVVDRFHEWFGVSNAVQAAYLALAFSILMVIVPPLYMLVRLLPTGGLRRRPRRLRDGERLALVISRETGNPYQSPLHS